MWRLLDLCKVLKYVHPVPFLMALAIMVVIATITAIAKIAYEDRSWVALFMLLVTIVQVLEFEFLLEKITLFVQPWRNLYMAWMYLSGGCLITWRV